MRHTRSENLDQDFIRGKGAGLITSMGSLGKNIEHNFLSVLTSPWLFSPTATLPHAGLIAGNSVISEYTDVDLIFGYISIMQRLFLTHAFTVLVTLRRLRQWFYRVESLCSLSRLHISASHLLRLRKLSRNSFDWPKFGTVFCCWTRRTSFCRGEICMTQRGML